MNTKTGQREESGQILVILTVGIVALLAITALALDAGMIYSDRRYDQNAADASALSGAGAAAMSMENISPLYYSIFNCVDYTGAGVAGSAYQSAIAAAQSRASSNNFSNLPEDDPMEAGIDGEYGVEVLCHADPSLFGPRYLDVHVMISSTLQTAFAHMFYGGPVRNTVEAVARVDTPNDAGWGFGLATLNPDCKPSDVDLEFDGGGAPDPKIILYGAGAHSNSCITRGGNVSVYTVPTGFNPAADPSDGSITGRPPVIFVTPGGYTSNGNGEINPGDKIGVYPPTQNSELMPPVYLEDLIGVADLSTVCPAAYDNPKKKDDHSFSGGGTIQPLTYTNITVHEKEDLVMPGGLYCLTGEFSVGGGSVKSVKNTDPDSPYYNVDGVTILLLNKAIVSITGGDIDLRAPSNSDLTPFPHLLFYAAKGNNGKNQILGSSSSKYEGTILMPDAYVHLGGTSKGVSDGPEYTTQVVAWDISVRGTATLKLFYDGSKVFTTGARIYLQK